MTEEARVLDTHATDKPLAEHELSDKQAEGTAALQEEPTNSQLALKKAFEDARLGIQQDIAAAATKVIRWYAGFSVAIIALQLTALVLLR